MTGETADSPDFTADDFLGGRLSVVQPRKGHRSGIEAVLIAAMAPLMPGETLIDIGSGVGVAGLCALCRVPDTRAVLVEADPATGGLARDNLKRNGFGDRAGVVVADVTVRGAVRRAGLTAVADHAVANPPFYDPASSRTSPAKAAAHAAPDADLDAWLRFAAAAVKPGGSLTLVHRAAALAMVLEAFGKRFGGAVVLPVHPRPGEAATRIVVQGRKGSRAPLAIRPGLVLHGARGHGFRAEVEAVLRRGAAFDLSS
ncbi:tRNA1(Val) (adenine(37)-N6)-methyltransferase [Microbaculum marinisediminis]|uniref:Methyltransferase n=1 Tax=Microbaculum marinisediminis TaxID=2931392 RepID=A0AAW5QTG9_9HYPH|nr:methyltransferase [Microbaculum sp. A6E488]MCT8970300.1 methyltransferase [Microbaculum sp. A6E488]